MSIKRNRQSGKVEAIKRKSLNPNNIQYNYFTEKLIIALKTTNFAIKNARLLNLKQHLTKITTQ